jgi:hypothetical protein
MRHPKRSIRMFPAAKISRPLLYGSGIASAGVGRQMARYFFDLVGNGRSIFDFQGHMFPDHRIAHEQAQLLALNLHVEEDEAFVGGRVDVCDVKGGVMFSVAICVPEQLAA